ncbi:hypothetical protein QBC39DRAFT_403003 [Podospora conica]|nr:hypothetical protein QBC39DRAFT_403003 [Schizothecium conicum]
MGDPRVPGHISDRVVELCTSTSSVSALMAEDPSRAPGDAWDVLYGEWKSSKPPDDDYLKEGSGLDWKDELERAARCGKWGPTQPSELFLKIYHDALCTLDEDPGRAMVSPSLMGSCGVVPLTIISVIPDIARHMSNVIARAEKEVFLATNYWEDSVASKFLTDAIRELDRRAGQRGTKVVVKIIYDRGSAKQAFEPHYYVSEKEYTGKNVKLPASEDIPNIDLQVMNYHQPIVGTFHAKYMVVDRKIALLQSNNIQDNANLEMMIRLEGPIVDSMYDVALLSWHKQLEPPLPSSSSPAARGGLGPWTNGKAIAPDTSKENGPSRDEILTGPSKPESIIHPRPTNQATSSTPSEAQTHLRSDTPNGAPDAQAETYLNRGHQTLSESRVQHPSPGPSHTRLEEHSNEHPYYDDDIAGEVSRVQTHVSPKDGESRMQAVGRLLDHSINKGFEGDRAPECPAGEEMTPYIAHPAHEPFPMALVNRSPYGPPSHKSVDNPQNAAWLSALRNAEKSVFIQSPTLNAEPLIPAIHDACERGVDVYCYICLGYNDIGELLPRQGGHNDMVAHKLYQSLTPAARQHLHYFWYVAKDQTRPLVQAAKKRSCHIKLMIVDEHVGIQGNGNQDTQSWYHSQEINVMVDSAEVCRAWIDGLRRNQNTHVYGALDREEGKWVDAEGKEADGVLGVEKGMFSWTKGVVGAVKRVKGTGGF